MSYIFEYLSIKDFVKVLNNTDDTSLNHSQHRKELLNRSSYIITKFFRHFNDINKNIDENEYYALNMEVRKKYLLRLYFFEYTSEYRLSWYNNEIGWKRDIINKYRTDEFEDKESFTRYEFYRFQSRFKLDEVEAIGY